MSSLQQDLRYGERILVRNPGFTLIAVFTLALGIGANTAIFSVINALILSPVTIAEPESVAAIWRTPFSWENYEEESQVGKGGLPPLIKHLTDLRSGAAALPDL